MDRNPRCAGRSDMLYSKSCQLTAPVAPTRHASSGLALHGPLTPWPAGERLLVPSLSDCEPRVAVAGQERAAAETGRLPKDVSRDST
jgi:hypothetical protein